MCSQVDDPELGSQRNCLANTRMSMMPSQKLGTDCPTSEITDTNRSSSDLGRNAARMPSGKLTTSASTIAVAASLAVAVIRSATDFVTGRLSQSESPKSSRTTSPRKTTYCRTIESFNPRLSRSASTSSTVAVGPSINAAGSPGTMRIAIKMIVRAPHNTKRA